MVRLRETYIENRERIQPSQANNYGSAHGGEVMKVMDEVGAMSAMRFAGETCVTAGVDGLSFERPIPVGDIALVESYVYGAGRSSVTVFLCVDREDPRTGQRETTNTSHFTFVAVDEAGTPVAVPELTVDSDRERRLRERARRE